MSSLQEITRIIKRMKFSGSTKTVRPDIDNLLQAMSVLKGCLRYKTITSRNVSSEAQIKNFFIRRKITFRSQDIQVFVFLTIL